MACNKQITKHGNRKDFTPIQEGNAKSKYTLNQNRVGKQEFKNNSKNI